MRPRRRARARRGVFWLLLGFLSAGLASWLFFKRRDRALESGAGEGRQPAPREPPAPPAEHAYWVAGPAANLHVRDGGGEPPGRGLPVLFVHSLAGNGGQWRAQLDLLRAAGRRAVALDLRGHGASEPAEDGDYSIERLAGDVAAVADQLGLRRFVLAGHSLGALVAIEYAARHPDRVAGLLLVDPNGDLTDTPRASFEPFLSSLRADPHGELTSYYRQLLVHAPPAAAARVLADVRETAEEAIAGGIEAAFAYPPLPALDAYPGRKLAVVSDLNDLPVSLHRRRPDLPTRWIPRTGHWLQMDAPEAFNRVLEEFLGAL
ncbi:MAG TPA: alpha/beta fold hydrolase [Thermoanaerobaculia bacterium]|nr:alpha/beta fold hydrolase [Thermoanaerobaculia bacterium]